MRNDKDLVLRQIASHLIINASFLNDLSLFHGKTGIMLFFYTYARYTNNPIYEEFAGDLLDEVIEEMHDRISLDFENGLSGIGWGMLYLLKHGYIDGDPNEIFEEIDAKIMEVNLFKVRDCSLKKGITGILVYLSSRLSFQSEVSDFDANFISDLQKVITNRELNVEFDLDFIINQRACSSLEEVGRTTLGLFNGYAGYGLKLLVG